MTQLDSILKGVSRSFYLSLKFLPRRVQGPMRLAFLACKAADTITDTRLIVRTRRLELLHLFRERFAEADPNLFAVLQDEVADSAENPWERQLLLTIPNLFELLHELPPADLRLIRELVQELTQGMILDLTRFPGESSRELQSLENDEDLDQYTYYVAGCVGIFWTRVLREHFKFARGWDRKAMKEHGRNFGKGLQMVNILRDLPRDLQQGRCYLPAAALRQRGLAPHHLLDTTTLEVIRPYLLHLIKQTRTLLHCARPYAAAHPVHALRLKWAVLLPMSLGLKTLDLLERSKTWFDPQQVIKVKRPQVYRSMGTSLLTALVT